MKFRQLVLATAVAAVLAPVTLRAQTADGPVGRIREVCKAELAAHCADAQKSGPPFLCLVANKEKLGPGCTAAVAEVEARRQKVRVACKPDAEKHCKDGDGRQLMACLRTKASELSKDCTDAMADLPGPAAKKQ